jgi:hypothetical protein
MAARAGCRAGAPGRQGGAGGGEARRRTWGALLSGPICLPISSIALTSCRSSVEVARQRERRACGWPARACAAASAWRCCAPRRQDCMARRGSSDAAAPLSISWLPQTWVARAWRRGPAGPGAARRGAGRGRCGLDAPIPAARAAAAGSGWAVVRSRGWVRAENRGAAGGLVGSWWRQCRVAGNAASLRLAPFAPFCRACGAGLPTGRSQHIAPRGRGHIAHYAHLSQRGHVHARGARRS